MVNAGLKRPDDTSHMVKANVATPKPELIAMCMTEDGGFHDSEQPQTKEMNNVVMRNSAKTSTQSLRVLTSSMKFLINSFMSARNPIVVLEIKSLSTYNN